MFPKPPSPETPLPRAAFAEPVQFLGQWHTILLEAPSRVAPSVGQKGGCIRMTVLCSDSRTALGGSPYSTYFTPLNGKHFGQYDSHDGKIMRTKWVKVDGDSGRAPREAADLDSLDAV